MSRAAKSALEVGMCEEAWPGISSPDTWCVTASHTSGETIPDCCKAGCRRLSWPGRLSQLQYDHMCRAARLSPHSCSALGAETGKQGHQGR